jgi:diguanylate cyclase (GGDEF)-like protein
MEIDRFQRYKHPFTIVYFDLDDFKMINDRFGHIVGDEVLITIASSVEKIIRKTDTMARLGGDEFAILFPETDNDSSRLLFEKLSQSIKQATSEKGWSVTFSSGVITCLSAPKSVDQLIDMADHLMYEVKAEGKNSNKYKIFEG